jgi:hypothetical protein
MPSCAACNRYSHYPKSLLESSSPRTWQAVAHDRLSSFQPFNRARRSVKMVESRTGLWRRTSAMLAVAAGLLTISDAAPGHQPVAAAPTRQERKPGRQTRSSHVEGRLPGRKPEEQLPVPAGQARHETGRPSAKTGHQVLDEGAGRTACPPTGAGVGRPESLT